MTLEVPGSDKDDQIMGIRTRNDQHRLDLNDLNEFKCDWKYKKKVIDQQTIENADSPTNMWFNHG